MAAILMLCSGLAGIGLAQTSPAPPQPLPQEQFDALVEAVKKAVADELKAQGAPPKAAPAKPASASPPDDDQPNLLGALGQQLSKVFAGMPLLVNSLAELPRVLDESPTGGSSTGRFFSILLVTLITALAVEATLRAVLTRLKVRLAANAAPEKGVRSLIYLGLLALLDALPVLGLWLAGQLILTSSFTVAALQQRLAFTALTALLIWRVYALILRLIVRPDLPAARLCEIEDGEAHRFYRHVLTVLAVIIFMRLLVSLLLATGTPDSAVAASRLVTLPLGLALLLWLVVGSKEAAY